MVSSSSSGPGGGAGGETTGVGGSSGDALTLLTVNLWNGAINGDVDERTALVAEAIQVHAPDFVSLQEVVQSGDLENRAEVLALATGYDWHWEKAYEVPFYYEEGTAVLSRHPITATERRELPHQDLAGVVRLAVSATATTPFGEVSFVATHTYVQDDDDKKADQAHAAWAFVHEHTAPTFIAGDFNAEPDTLAMRFLRGEAEHQGDVGDLIDGWAATHPGEVGYTHPSDNPDKRIDYIYAPAGVTVTACEHVLAAPTDGIYASDHIGVLCRVAM